MAAMMPVSAPTTVTAFSRFDCLILGYSSRWSRLGSYAGGSEAVDYLLALGMSNCVLAYGDRRLLTPLLLSQLDMLGATELAAA